MVLWFENGRGKIKRVAKIDGRKRKEEIDSIAMEHIRSYCNERNFKIYYVRVWSMEWRGKQAKVFDVGSHTEFFYLTK